MGALDRERKIKMFLQCEGKCEYCGIDMVLTFKEVNKYPNAATFDHFFNRDHEQRYAPNENRERRIFLVCWECNNKKAKEEPNNQEPKSLNKIIKRIVPKEKWTNEKFIERITKVIEEEQEIQKSISLHDKEIRKHSFLKKVNEGRLSKKVKYRNLILKHQNESHP